jgi:tripartite-type tricarboxylate transporter receptor subunit TctC
MKSTPLLKVTLALAMMLFAVMAGAQEYPVKGVRIVVGYVAGGGPDVVARTVANRLSEILGQPFVVENRPGAGATMATAQVAKMPADGYTLLLGETGQLVIAPFIYKSLPYDPIKDFTPISLLVTSSGLLLVASAKSSIKTIQDLVREARAKPGKIDYGSSGVGTIHHIAMEAFKADLGLAIEHIPYKGSGQSVTSILSGDVPLLITSGTAAGTHIRAGSLNVLAVSSAARLPAYPDVPAMAELIKDFEFLSEMGLLAPAGMPQDRVARLSRALTQAMENADLREAFRKVDYTLRFTTPQGYTENLRRNLQRYERAVRAAKITATE